MLVSREKLASVGGRLLDLVFTPRCVGCRREGVYLCHSCLDKGTSLPKPYFLGNAGAGEACLVETIALEGVLSCYAMEGAAREAVHQLKYRDVRAMAPVLGAMLGERVRASGMSFQGVCAVPLHPKRLRERGYNQSALLAKEAARSLGLPLHLDVVRRTRYGQPQARSANMAERRSGVRDAFSASVRLDGARLLLVDDVCTTGATLDACAHALKSAGAASVWGLTVARAL